MKQHESLRAYFVDNCINLRAFSEKHGLDPTTLSKVLNGKLKCEVDRDGLEGKTAKVAKVLWDVGAWSGEKPKILQKIENEAGGVTPLKMSS